MKKRYEVSENWKSLGFKYQPSERGCLEEYIYDETLSSPFDDRKYRFRGTVIIDLDTGKPCNVGVNFLVDGDCIYYENEEQAVKSFTGIYCEELCLEFLKKKLYMFNKLLHTNFEIKGLPVRTHGIWN